jgi:hypothetical protein
MSRWDKVEWNTWIGKGKTLRGGLGSKVIPRKTEMEAFLDRFASEFGKDTQKWFTQFDTLSKAWQKSENAIVMLKMLQCQGDFQNFNTALLVYSGNLVNFIVKCHDNLEMRRLSAEVSFMVALAVARNPLREIINIKERVGKKREEFLAGTPLSRFDRDSLNDMFAAATLIAKNPRGNCLALATQTTDWYSRACIHGDAMYGLSSPIKPSIELRNLIGDPFERMTGNSIDMT